MTAVPRKMTTYTIDIVSDTVCPWCYIGHKRLSSAIKTHLSSNPNDTFHTRWHPYQLNPDAPRGQSTNKLAMYASKFGEQRSLAMIEHMKGLGESEGIHFSYGGNTGNTYDSHRLIALAAQKEAGQSKEGQGLQTRVVEELFAEYFEKEGDITKHDVLERAAVKAGLDETDVKQTLGSDQFGQQVGKELREARMQGISGVPNFTINEQYEISGGQEPAAFMQIFNRIKTQK